MRLLADVPAVLGALAVGAAGLAAVTTPPDDVTGFSAATAGDRRGAADAARDPLELAPAVARQPIVRASVDELRGRTSADRASARTPPAPVGPAPIVASFPAVDGCDATVPAGSPPNGQLAADELCSIGDDHLLRADAAAAYAAMDAAFAAEFGTGLQISDSYRSYGSQVSLYARKPGLAARPGTSNHGWGVAVDLFSGVETYGSAEHGWLVEHGAEFGWVNPPWAQADGSRPEPWHWEFEAVLLD